MAPSNQLRLYNVIRSTIDEHTPYMDFPERASTWYTYEEALAAAKRNLLDEWDIDFLEKYEETTDGSGENAKSDGFQAYALFPEGEEMWVYIEEVLVEGPSYKLRFKQEKLIRLAGSVDQTHNSNQTTTNSNAIIPSIPAHNQVIDNSLLANISEDEARQLCQNNKTIREIIRGNVMFMVSAEVQKVKDEHAKILADIIQKAALKINMTENRIRVTNARLQLVEQAAQNTPERAVAQVWAEAKNYEPTSVPSILASNNPPVGDSGGQGRDLNMNHGGLHRGGSNMGPNNSPGLLGSKRPRDDVSTSGHMENTGGKRIRED